MNDISRLILEVSLLTFIVTSLILVFVLIAAFRDRRKQNNDEVLEAIEGTRKHLSSNQDQVLGELRSIRSTGNWISDRIEALISVIAKYFRGNSQ